MTFQLKFSPKNDGFKIFYKTCNNERLGRVDTPKNLDNTSKTTSNIDNVLEGEPEQPCSWNI